MWLQTQGYNKIKLQQINIKLKLIRFEVMFIVQACQNNRLINLLAFAFLFSSPIMLSVGL